MPKLVVYCHFVSVSWLLNGLRSGESKEELKERANPVLNRIGEYLSQKGEIGPCTRGNYSYAREEDLLKYTGKATDFFVLDLIGHFRVYGSELFPTNPSLELRDSGRQRVKLSKRGSGQITGSFAEAIAPWVLEHHGIMGVNRFFRLKSLTPGRLGHRVPDFVIRTKFDEARHVPCEVKHLSGSGFDKDAVLAGVEQVVAGMVALDSRLGCLVVARSPSKKGLEYRIELIRLLEVPFLHEAALPDWRCEVQPCC